MACSVNQSPDGRKGKTKTAWPDSSRKREKKKREGKGDRVDRCRPRQLEKRGENTFLSTADAEHKVRKRKRKKRGVGQMDLSHASPRRGRKKEKKKG